MDITYYATLWQKNQKLAQDSETYWDNRAAFFNGINNSTLKQKKTHTFIQNLVASGILSSSSSVLDIGCGVGSNAIPIAKIASKVVGTDISSQAIAFAKENAIKANLANIEFVKSDWTDINIPERNWEHKFELVLASMCPGIDGLAALKKMNQASSSRCMLSLFASREDSIRNELATLTGIPSAGWHHAGTDVYCIFNILWLMGLYPEIRITESTWEHNFGLEEGISHYASILAEPGSLTTSQLSLIRSYLSKHIENNHIKELIQAKIAWISWKAK